MKKQHNIIIAGAGGIAQAAALILAEWSEVKPNIYIGNRTLSKAYKVKIWVEKGTTKPCSINAFHLQFDNLSEEMKAILQSADIILDCLPGNLAPQIAKLAKDFQLHYANLTEYVAETNKIIALAQDAKTGFILQTGLAPGYINVLAHHLFNQFCSDFDVNKVDKLEFKVGALTDNAIPPHYYGFTWSPVGVATEYVEDAIVLRDYKKILLPSLSERGRIIIDGITYEDDLTSGGAADLPNALAGRVAYLDYKTLRYPGHYSWIENQINSIGYESNTIAALQQRMETSIPHMEDDRIVLYAAVEVKDEKGILQRREAANLIFPQKVGKHKLRAIQITTAAPLIQSAQLLLESSISGIILQSHLDPLPFLNGKFIKPVYGEV